MAMADENRPGIGSYPLTIAGFDAAGNECYRTQLDWAGSERDLSDVPSADLDARRPQWKTVKVYDQAGKVVLERSNDRNDESAEDAVAARGPSYANDKRPVVDGDVPNDKDGEASAGDRHSDGKSSVENRQDDEKSSAKNRQDDEKSAKVGAKK